MKNAFSTLADTTWSLQQFLDAAVRFGYDGIDFRGIQDELDITRLPAFNEQLDRTLAEIQKRGLEIAGLGTSARCATDPDKLQEYLAEVERYCALAEKVGRPWVRVFGGRNPAGVTFEQALKLAAENLKRYGDIAAKYGATIVVETHDDWCASEAIQALMERADHPAVAVVWDVHHPWRTTGESPQQTWNNIGRWVRYVHLKDAHGRPGGPQQLCLTGRGDVPVREALDVLKANGYDGWLTLEWEKRWHPEMPPAEEGLKAHIEYIRQIL